MAFKKKVFKYLALSTLVLGPITDVTVSLLPTYAQEATNLSVANYLQQGITATKGQTVTIEGYITGSLKSAKAYGEANTNLALGQTASASAEDTVGIQLPKGNIRNQYNIVDNPQLIGKKVRITGISDNYFSRPGIKSTQQIEVIDDTTPPANTESETTSTDNETKPATPADNETKPVASIETETTVSIPTDTSLETLRRSPQQNTYSVKGKIISPINGWGGNGFYMVDESQHGMYVYPRQTFNIQTGDTVHLTGTLSTFKGELQLVDITTLKVSSEEINTPLSEIHLPNLPENKQSTLVQLKHVTVGDISVDHYKTASFTVTDVAGNELPVRLDNRTGVNAEQLLSKIDKGDTIHVTGILSTFNNQPQLKPFLLNHFEVVKKAETSPATQALKIGDIQGEGHVSPYNQKAVTVKEVIVTAVENDSRFYVADVTPDTNDKTSNGISVFKPNHRVAVGDVLTIDGVVNEYVGQGYNEKKQTDLSITEIKADTIKKTDTGQIPAPIVLGQDKHIPTSTIDNDGMTSFDPDEDALDFWEALEGMVVAVDNAKILGPMAHKEVYVLPENSTSVLNKMGGITLGENDFNPERIPLLFKNGAFAVKSGDSFVGRLSGPVSYSYTNYKVLINDTVKPTIKDGQIQPELTTIPKDDSKLTIAAYNIENFSANANTTSQEKVSRIASSFINNLNTPDIIGLVEVQDNNGTVNDGTTDASLSAQRLINEIVKQGGPRYTYVDIAPENNQDGGAPGSNIRTGFLYNPQRVSLSNKPVGQTAAWENGELKYSLARFNPLDAAWDAVRKPLVAEFEFNNEKVTVIATHLNSKRGDNGLFGRVQPVTFHSEIKRRELASQLRDFVAQGIQNNQNIVMLGDFNDFEFTQPLRIIEEAGMSNLVSRHDLADRFSYFYQGNNQTLDHILISNNLLDRYTFDMLHINASFMDHHGRASDHDPVIVQLDLQSKKADEEKTDKEIVKPELPEVTTTTEQPETAPNTEQLETAPNTEQPEIAPNTEQSEIAPNTEQSEIAPNTEQSEIAPNTEQSKVAPNTKQPKIKSSEKPYSATGLTGQSTTRSTKSIETHQKNGVKDNTTSSAPSKTLPYTGQKDNVSIIGIICIGFATIIGGIVRLKKQDDN